MNDYQNFESFVKDLHRFKKTNAFSWCKERQSIIQEHVNRQKIVLTELNYCDFQDPFSLISKDYQDKLYKKTLFESELGEFKDIQQYIEHLIQRCENHERIRNIIENYLTYIVELHFEQIIYSLSKLSIIENNLIDCIKITSTTRKKVTSIKSNFLKVASKFVLAKQKKRNFHLLKQIAKNKLLFWKTIIFEYEQSLRENHLQNCYFKLSLLQNELKNSVHLKNLKISCFFQNILKEKLKSLLLHADKLFSNIFLSKNEMYQELFLFNLSFCNLDELLNKFRHVFKDNVFMVIKETFYSFSEDKFISKEDIKKLRDLNKFFKIDENRFVFCLNQTLQNLIKICENYVSYVQMHRNFDFQEEKFAQLNKKFLNEIELNNKNFYEIVEKKLTKLYTLFKPNIKEFSTKNIIFFSYFNSVALDYLNHLFDVNYSKHLKLQIKTLVSENLKTHNLNTIKKIGILLEGDLWSKVSLPDDHRCFEIEKIRDMVPNNLKSFINIFNEDEVVSKQSIRGMFPKLIDVAIFQNNVFQCDVQNLREMKMVFDAVKMKNIMVSSSTYNLLKSFHVFILFFNFFNSITFDIFLQLFQTIDFYIFCSMRMIAPKSNLKRLYEFFNTEELKKKSNGIFSNKIESIVDTLFYQKTFKSVRMFIDRTKRFIEVCFSKKIDLFASDDNDEDYDSSDIQLPRMNFQIQSTENNNYHLLIESIVWFESVASLVRILRKMRCFTSNIQLDFQKNNIIDILNQYKVFLKELQSFIYLPLCENLFKFDNNIMGKILSVKWDQNDSDIDSMFTDANQFINQIYQEIVDKYEKLDVLSKNSLTEKSKRRFLKSVMIYFKEKLLETFSKIKKCSTFGRSIMLKDMKFLKSKMESKFGVNEFSDIFNYIDNYINNWYSDENELMSYIKEKQVNYKFVSGIVNTGPYFVKLNKQQRKEFQSKLEDVYLQLLDS